MCLASAFESLRADQTFFFWHSGLSEAPNESSHGAVFAVARAHAGQRPALRWRRVLHVQSRTRACWLNG